MSPPVILVMAFGTPGAAGDADAARFLEEVIGHQPTPGHVANLLHRIDTIGGSPLAAITETQASELKRELGRRHGPDQFPVLMAMRHGNPAPEWVLSDVPSGERLLILPLSPQDSADRKRYRERIEATAAHLGRSWDIDEVPAFGTDRRFVEVIARRLRITLQSMPATTPVVFTAHSLPEALPRSYQYCADVAATAEAVALACHLDPTRWSVAFQSIPPAARQPWLGPPLNDVVEEMAARANAIVVSPVQFLSDHMEILYDIDVTARGIAAAHGCTLVRVTSPNASPDLTTLCADMVEERLAAGVGANAGS